MKDAFESVGKGVAGVASAATPYWIGQLSPLAEDVKLAGAVVGCLVSTAFFVSLCFDIRRKWRNRNL